MLNASEIGDQGTPASTIEENLKIYNISAKIRRLRLRKAMGLAELAKHTGLSSAMLSKLENGHVIPTIQTLLRIALVYGVGLDYFFSDENQKMLTVIRAAKRQEFHEKMGGVETTYRFQSLDYKAVDRKSSAFVADFHSMPPEDVPTHEHPGSEFIYVLEGRLGIIMEGRETMLDCGDSAYLDPSYKHGYRRIGPESCRAIVVTVP